MSAILRDRVYRIPSWDRDTSDWVVTRRDANGDTHLRSEFLQTTITVHESKLVVVDGGVAQQSFLDPGGARQSVSPVAAGSGRPSLDPAASSFASPGAEPVQSTPLGLHRQPLARLTDPDTAHMAATTARSSAAANRMKVLIAHANAGERGLTGDELEQATGLPYEVIGPRRPSLESDGLIVATGQKRPNRRGNMQAVYRITEAGRVTADRAVA